MICPHSTLAGLFPCELDHAISDINLSRQSELITKSYQLAARSSTKASTIQGYQGRLSTMAVYFNRPPPYTPDEVRAYLYSLYESEAGQNAGDHSSSTRSLLSGGLRYTTSPHHATRQSAPICVIVCIGNYPVKGNPARRALTFTEQKNMISLADGKIKIPGDVWHRNATLLCLDLTTALRIGDVLCLKHCDLTWNHNSLRLKIWLMDGKKDKWSSGMWSNEYHGTHSGGYP